MKVKPVGAVCVLVLVVGLASAPPSWRVPARLRRGQAVQLFPRYFPCPGCRYGRIWPRPDARSGAGEPRPVARQRRGGAGAGDDGAGGVGRTAEEIARAPPSERPDRTRCRRGPPARHHRRPGHRRGGRLRTAHARNRQRPVPPTGAAVCSRLPLRRPAALRRRPGNRPTSRPTRPAPWKRSTVG